MKKFVRAVAFTLCLLMATGIIAKAETPLSTGLEVLSAETRLIKCSVGGERVGFTKAEIKELVGVDFDYLTLSTLPPLSCGVLKVAGVDAVPNQKLSSAGIALLSFLPAKGFEESCSFGFTVAADGWQSKEIECVIRFSASPRFSPIAVSAQLKTYKNVSVTAFLGAYDPDGDSIEYVVEEYPTGGSISFADGAVTYTPTKDFSGEDSFTYYAVDDWGKKSGTAKASITVSDSQSGIYFADMTDAPEHLAAIRMSEEEVMTYCLIGDSYYFSPTEEVSRIDFAVMLVSAMGIDVKDKLYPTDVFTDTANQSRGKRLYLEAAVTSGVVEVQGESFRPNDSISVADALSMAERAAGDAGAISIGTAWAENGEELLTKKNAALLLCDVYDNCCD